MKVSIITIHDPDVNYGSTLQSCGTYQFIKSLGYDVQLIDYKPDYKSFKQRIKKHVLQIVFWKDAHRRRKKIDQYFAQHASLTRRYVTREDLFADPPVADVYITGSDVIWNRDVNPEGGDPAYYLGFVRSGMKMSYAPSMGQWQSDENVRHIVDQVSDFVYLSVREERSREQLEAAGLKNVKCVMDPVFLLDVANYQKQIQPNIYGDYTLVYLMSDTPEKRERVNQLARSYGDRVVAFGGFKRKSESDVFIRDAGVEDFLSLIYHAKHIITDSFHCTAFSLIFNKQFWYLPSIDSSMRIENMLQYVGLERRIISQSVKLDDATRSDICYEIVNELLRPKIEASKSYLRDALAHCN